MEFSFLTETIRAAQIVANQTKETQYVFCKVVNNDAQADFTIETELKGRKVLEVCHPVSEVSNATKYKEYAIRI